MKVLVTTFGISYLGLDYTSYLYISTPRPPLIVRVFRLVMLLHKEIHQVTKAFAGSHNETYSGDQLKSRERRRVYDELILLLSC